MEAATETYNGANEIWLEKHIGSPMCCAFGCLAGVMTSAASIAALRLRVPARIKLDHCHVKTLSDFEGIQSRQ